jgi:hypothetical protein
MRISKWRKEFCFARLGRGGDKGDGVRPARGRSVTRRAGMVGNGACCMRWRWALAVWEWASGH